MTGFVKAMRSEEAAFLDTNPLANHVLNVIARRARRTPDALNGLQVGECFVGHKGLGLSEQQYRTVKKNLQKWGLVEFKKAERVTDRGTVAKLLNSDIYDINEEDPNGRPTEDQRKGNGRVTEGQRQTKNVIMEEGKNDKKKTVRVRFIPPQQNDVFDYMIEKGVNRERASTESEKYFNFYETNGWMAGKNPMRKWKSSVSGWIGRMNDGQYQQPAKQNSAAIDDNDTAWFDEYERRQQAGNSLAGQPPVQGAESDPHGMETGITIEGSSGRIEDPMDNGLFGEEYHRHGNNR